MSEPNEPYAEAGSEPKGPGKGILGSLATLAVTGLIVSEGLKYGSRAAASFLTKRFAGTAGVVGKDLAELGANYLKVKAPQVTESVLARELKSGEKAYQSWSGAWNRMDKIYNSTSYLQEGAEHAVKDVTRATNYHYTKTAAQATDFLFRPGLQQRATGFGVTMAKTLFGGSISGYISQEAANVFNKSAEPNSPAWYNLPGQAVNFAKFAVSNVVSDALIFGGGAKFLGKMGFEGAVAGLRVAKQTLMSQPATERALDRVGKGAEWIFQGLRGVESAIRAAGIRSNAAVPESMGALGTIKSLAHPTNYLTAAIEYKRGLVSGWGKFHALRKEVPKEQFGAEIMGVLSTAAHIHDPREAEGFLKDYYTKTQSNRQSGMEYILGLKRKTNFEGELKAAEQRAVASLKLPHKKEERDAFVDGFQKRWKRNAEYLHRTGVQVEAGFYTGVNGQTIDLRASMPNNIRNSAASALYKVGFHVPGQEVFGFEGKIRPFNLLWIPDLLRKKTFHASEKFHEFVGTNRTVSNEFAPRQQPLGSMVKEGLYDASNGMGVFSAGTFYHLADGKIRRVSNPRFTFKLMSKGVWSDNMAWLSGHYPLKREYDEAMHDPDRPFVRRVLDRLDIGLNNQEGIFGRLGSAMRKYTWSESGGNKHPWHLKTNLAARASGMGTAAAGSPVIDADIIHSLDTLFMTNVKEGSALRNKDVLDAILPAKFQVQMKESANEYKTLLDEARTVWSGGSGSVHPMVRRLGHEWNLEHIFDMTKGVDDYNHLGRIMEDTVSHGGRDVYHSLLDVITLQNMVRKNQQGHQVISNIGHLTETLMEKGKIGELEAASLRVMATSLKMQEKKNLLNNYLSENGDGIVGNRIGGIVDLLKKSHISGDIDTLNKHFYKSPMKNWILLEETPFVSKYAQYDMVKKDFRSSPYTAIPWKSDGKMSTRELTELALEKGNSDPSPISVTGERLTRSKVIYGALTRRFTNLLGNTGLGLNLGAYSGGGVWNSLGGPASQLIMQGIMAKRVGAIGAAALAYGTIDKLVDVMPGLQNTPLAQGITPFLADQMVKYRMGVGMLADVTGITSTAKYLEGLFPGSIDSPMMRFARGVILPVWAANKIGFKTGEAGKSMAGGLLAGMALGAAQGFGTFDLTKNTQELKDIYSGRDEVPVRRGRWWDLSSSPYEGGRIRNFQPNWYAKLKSQYMDTPDGWGSPMEQFMYKPWPMLDFNPIGFLLGGRYHYANQHYYSRPYPISNTAFNEMPIIGPAAAATLGRIIAPPKVMHDAELKDSLDRYGYSVNNGNTQRMGFLPGTTEMAKAFPVSPYGVRQAVSQQVYNLQQATGLFGFAMQTASSELMGFEQPFDGDNVLESAGEITSMRRSYYDKELGGMGGYNEEWRRFVPKKRASQIRVNPLRNRMPKWLPVQFKLGDAYAQVPEGELLLPGRGYSAAHDVNMTYPVSADMLGLSMEDTVRRMLSLGRPTPIGRDEVERGNARIHAAAHVFEPYNDVSGTHDGIIRKGRRKILQKVKNLDTQDLTDLIGPTETDISEINFYMRMAGVAEGTLQYKVDGVPILAYPVQYSEKRFQKDMDVVTHARQKASQLYANGVGFEGESYSHLDRAHVLSNVAPWSNEFKDEFAMAKTELRMRGGDLSQLDKIKHQRDAIMRSSDFYPRRFLGKVMTPDATYNSMSENMNIKAAADYSLPERALGALWEGYNGVNHPFDRFHSYKSPLESYKSTMLYGRTIKMWQHPFDHWADAYSKGFMSKDDPMSGYLAGFMAGYAFGPQGLGSKMAGGAIGAAYGTVHGIYRKVHGGAYIPGTIQDQREINRYFDSMSYYKNMMMYDATGKDEYLEEARSTMAGIVPSDLSRNSWSHTFRATPYMEKPYIMAFLHETDPKERAQIAKFVPDDVRTVLEGKWAKMDGLKTDARVSRVSLDKMPRPDWEGWAPEVDLDDVKLISVENKGFEAHDFGLGWKDQMARIRNSPYLPGPVDMYNAQGGSGTTSKVNQSEVRRLIEKSLSDMGVGAFVSVSPSYHDNAVTVVG